VSVTGAGFALPVRPFDASTAADCAPDIISDVDATCAVDAIDVIVLVGLAMGDTGAACCRALPEKESGGTGPASERVVFKDREVDACSQ
jgi:hypothetical protein